jgi:hypothetical protein
MSPADSASNLCRSSRCPLHQVVWAEELGAIALTGPVQDIAHSYDLISRELRVVDVMEVAHKRSDHMEDYRWHLIVL